MLPRECVVLSLIALFLFGFVPPVGAAPAGPLAQVIEAAKKEGTVAVKLHSNFTPNSIRRLEKGVKDKYSVDLKIDFLPVENMSKSIAEATMEKKAGAVPSIDLITLSTHIVDALKNGVLESVDWKSLLTGDLNPRVAHEHPLMRGGIVYYTGHIGLMYNPEKIKADEIPKTLGDLVRSKWKNRGGIAQSPSTYARMAFLLGKDKVFSDLRTLLKNGAIQGFYPVLHNRYLLGELWWCFTSSVYLKAALDKGMPAKWQSLDIAEVTEFGSVLLKGARHPNAAKLVALYLASPEGAKFTLEEAGAGNMWYPGNYEHDITVQDQKQGVREFFTCRDSDILEFVGSKENDQWEKEVQLILQTGGER